MQQMTIDVRRCAEFEDSLRVEREEGNSADLQITRATHNEFHRNFDNLSRKRWRFLRASFDPRKPVFFDWWIARRFSPQQLHPFRALAVSEGCDILSVAHYYYASLTENSTISVHTLSEESAPSPSTDSNIDGLFKLTNLKRRCRYCISHNFQAPME